MRDAILLSGFAGFAGGILCRSFFMPTPYLLAFLLVPMLLLLGMWLRVRRALYLVCVCAILGLVLGFSRVALVPATLPGAFVPLLDTDVELEGVVVAEPDLRETAQRVTVEVGQGEETTRVLAVAALYPEVSYGDRVRVHGSLERPEPFETDTGRTFRYDRFLAKDGIFAIAQQASLSVLAPGEGIESMVMGALIDGKHLFREGLARAMPEPAASLASGLITGGKQGLGPDLLDAFIMAGLVHIVVLSGYNVMIVAEGVLKLLGFLPKRASALVAGLVIGLFVLAAGAGSASIRAGLMAALALTARATGRTYAVVRALLLVAVAMLLFNPLLLAYDPGFQLSFIATLGLILLSPLLEERLLWIKSAFWRDLLAATLAAQVGVLPLLLYQTGLFSAVSLPANLLVLPFVPLAMALSAVAGVIGIILPPLATLFGLPAYALLTLIIETTRIAASLPLAGFSVPQFPFLLVAACYAALGCVIAKAPRKESSRALRA